MNQLAKIDDNSTAARMLSSQDTTQYLTAHIGDQMFGLPIMQIQDVIEMMPLTQVPLAPREIAGIMNLRGRVVTAIHLDRLLNLPAPPEGAKTQSVVFEHEGELYSLIVHKVGDVMSLPKDDMKDPPPTLSSNWLALTDGIFRLDNSLLLILDLKRLFAKLRPAALHDTEE
jgi:purine-binding chemotaxis protein CheW